MKQVSEATKNNLKEATKLSEDIENQHQNLEKSKKKYQKSFLEYEIANNNYLKAEADPTIPRAEIARLKYLSDSLCAQCEDHKGVYTSQLLNMNKLQAEYYYKDLPGVLNSLQNIEIDRIDYFKYVMDQSVAAEKQVAPIIAKCNDDKKCIIQSINPEADSYILIER